MSDENKVKRYDHCSFGMQPDQEGERVSHADFQKRDELVRELVEAPGKSQWDVRGRCPVCAGFYPNRPTDHGHSATCLVGNVLAKAKAIDAEETRS